ncbi:putative methyltransferase [Leptodactylus fuscus]
MKFQTNGRSLEMAVDVGCGTGRYTLPLAPHFKKVLGIDISESQINLATQCNSVDNVSYMIAPAEKLPMNDASVDLVTAGLAAHWFIIDKFASEAVRVLKTKGCLAVHALYPPTEIEYEDLSHDLNVVLSEVYDTLFQYTGKFHEHMMCQYQSDHQDKFFSYRITDISVKVEMSIPEIIGYIQSIVMFQIFMDRDQKKAEQFLEQTEKRFREILGEKADSARLNMHVKHYCVLACKD